MQSAHPTILIAYSSFGDERENTCATHYSSLFLSSSKSLCLICFLTWSHLYEPFIIVKLENTILIEYVVCDSFEAQMLKEK